MANVYDDIVIYRKIFRYHGPSVSSIAPPQVSSTKTACNAEVSAVSVFVFVVGLNELLKLSGVLFYHSAQMTCNVDAVMWFVA